MCFGILLTINMQILVLLSLTGPFCHKSAGLYALGTLDVGTTKYQILQ